ncbi:hypothetical protein J3R30DRAFT_3280620 [Lentinula aciculospora]|uniref:Uncharacterized protein n=1 Tax=Lentinula aciculospora TaxID=153920 RepID=A0A9W9AQW3_9AGAR|nr:hypothetical protein J3R30DRAFT_3280620 [Lentinula aciculospora]
MSGKQLSSGTLSLKFMQNAQRAKQLKEVELEKAHVEDDGQWEIAKEIRESWGLAESSDISDTVSYESSYLPFLFPSIQTTSNTADCTPKGRRVFKRGKEVKAATEPSTSSVKTETIPLPVDSASSSSVRKPKSGAGIIASRLSTKSAKLAIFDNSQVGIDLRPPPNNNIASFAKVPTSSKTVFLKPAGVDEPKASGDSPHSTSIEEGVIPSARETKVKRERINSTTHVGMEDDGPKRKRKKKSKIATD